MFQFDHFLVIVEPFVYTIIEPNWILPGNFIYVERTNTYTCYNWQGSLSLALSSQETKYKIVTYLTFILTPLKLTSELSNYHKQKKILQRQSYNLLWFCPYGPAFVGVRYEIVLQDQSQPLENTKDKKRVRFLQKHQRSMDFEQYFTQEWKSVATATTTPENLNGCFDCNICFEFAHEPVVTLCGHLYCWPCIYKWVHVQSASLASDEHAQCPVCKAGISHTAMVPLYGRGQSLPDSDLERKVAQRGMAIPPRPAACGMNALISNTPATSQRLPHRNPYQNHNYDLNSLGSFEEAPPSPLLNLGGPAATGFHHPFVGMFGEMVYARVFGNSQSMYTYRNSYHVMSNSSPRLRRLEMQVDKSLNRISIFLFCCFLLCLILF